MAALFYTNHKLSDVTLMFYMWKEAAMAKLKEKAMKKQNQSHSSNKGPSKSLGIEIDTELANQ
jgi:hypothetical protein